jgi:hypothetical protein
MLLMSPGGNVNLPQAADLQHSDERPVGLQSFSGEPQSVLIFFGLVEARQASTASPSFLQVIYLKMLVYFFPWNAAPAAFNAKVRQTGFIHPASAKFADMSDR